MNVKSLTVAVLGSRPVSWAARRMSVPQLRVLAYHGVSNPRSFQRQLDEVLPKYSVIAGTDVVSAARGEAELPSDALWITFDDGLLSVTEHALPLLIERSIPATLFVSPGFVDGGQLPWWSVVETAVSKGWRFSDKDPDETLSCLKVMPDAARRLVVQSAAAHLSDADREVLALTAADRSAVGTWLASGMQVGNHTWDHPCLDCCDPDEQARQIVLADAWLDAFGAFAGGKVFAYPNGDWTASAEQTLMELGYDVALLFDHGSSRLSAWDPMRTSRFRIDAAASIGRTRAIISGSHSRVHNSVLPIFPAHGSTG